MRGGGKFKIQIYFLFSWERKNGPIKQGSIVLLRTGCAESWPDRKAFRGLHEDIDNEDTLKPTDMNFPGYDASSATYLTVEKGVIGVGTDCLSIDSGENSRVRKILKCLNLSGYSAIQNKLWDVMSQKTLF